VIVAGLLALAAACLAVALLLLPLVRTLRGRARPASEIAEDTISTAID
jgi:hypothetical protein